MERFRSRGVRLPLLSTSELGVRRATFRRRRRRRRFAWLVALAIVLVLVGLIIMPSGSATPVRQRVLPHPHVSGPGRRPLTSLVTYMKL